MTKPNHCPANERIKRRYLIRLREVKGHSVATVDGAAAAISRFEVFTCYRDFKKFHVEQVRSFKKYLSTEANALHSGATLSSATVASTLRTLRTFFMWLADQPGYRSAIRYSDADYFTPPAKDERIAAGRVERPGPELEEVVTVLKAMPSATVLDLRDRALVALILLTGVRDKAAVSLKLKHLDLTENRLVQDAREVKTKRSKTFVTYFFPVGGEALAIVTEWKACLVNELGFQMDGPLFPATAIGHDENYLFSPTGLGQKPWATTTPVREIFKSAFQRVNLPYHNPHSLRSTLVRLGERLCRTPEEFKAWSQNLGHSGVLTTFSAYGNVDNRKQSEIIRNLGNPEAKGDLASEMALLLQRHGKRV